VLQVLQGIAVVLLARWMGPEEFGEFSVVWAILLTASGVLALGLPTFTLRAAVRGDNQATEYALFLNIVSSVAGLVIGAVIAFVVSPFSPWLVLALAVPIAIEKNVEVRVGLGTEYGYAKLVNMLLVIRGILVLGLMVALHAFGVGTLIAYVIARIVAVGVSAVWMTARVRDWKASTIRPTDGSLDILPSLATTQAVVWARSLDVPIVASAVGAVGAGLYAATQKIMYPIFLLTDNLNLVVIGPIARGTHARARQALRLLVISALVLSALFGFASIWATPLTGLVLGAEYRDTGGVALRWLLIAAPALGIIGPLRTILQDKGSARQVSIIATVSTVFTLLGAWVGATLNGADGAALAYMIVAWIQVLLLVIDAQFSLRYRPRHVRID